MFFFSSVSCCCFVVVVVVGGGGGGGGGVNVTVNVKLSILSLINPHSVKRCRGAELWLRVFFISAPLY
jgi:hypothetical protein